MRRQEPILRQDRLTVYLREALIHWFDTPVMKQYGFVHARQEAMNDADLISIADDIPIEVKELWYASSVLAAVDNIASKVLHAKTAMHMLPRRTLFKLAASNRFSA